VIDALETRSWGVVAAKGPEYASEYLMVVGSDDLCVGKGFK
jgi:hypothetical protein